MTAPTLQYLHCPLRDCDWRTVDRSHLGTVILVDGEDEDGRPNLITRDALDVMQNELRGHMAQTHRRELQLMLAGIDGGRGLPVQVNLTQQISAEHVRHAPTALAVLAPRMRAQFASDLAKRNLRPLDPWPAVTVRRLVWAQFPVRLDQDVPSGMREAREDETPDLYQLELSTEAVPDTRTVEL